MQVGVADVDEARSGRIRRNGDGTGERRLVDEPVDEHVLPLVDVRADADGELCVPLQAFVNHLRKYTAAGAAAPVRSESSDYESDARRRARAGDVEVSGGDAWHAHAEREALAVEVRLVDERHAPRQRGHFAQHVRNGDRKTQV